MSFTEQETAKKNTKRLDELEGVISKAIKKG